MNIRDDIKKFGAEAAYGLAVNFPEFYGLTKKKEEPKVKYYDWAYATRKVKFSNPENIKLESSEWNVCVGNAIIPLFELNFESNNIKFRIQNTYYCSNKWHVLKKGEVIQYVDLKVEGYIFYQEKEYNKYLEKVNSIESFSAYNSGGTWLSDFVLERN